MGYAYALSPGKERKSALSSIKTGFKECTETLKQIETEFESSIGSIMIEMKGIQGFARICPGDVFEITVKYGENQKWKSRGKILKDGINQMWDHQSVLFKGLLDETLTIKAVEVKGLGKKQVLGRKLCETKNLFSPHPQLMTINLNNIGTLKLNLIITWNPLHGVLTNEFNLKSGTLTRSKSSLSLFGSMRSLPSLFSSSSLSNRNKSDTLPTHMRASTLMLNSPNSPKSAIITDPFDQSFLNGNMVILNSSSGVSADYLARKRNRMKKSHSAIAGISIKSNNSDHSTSSSGSAGSSIHFTGGSSGFASGSSYCSGSTSVPGSALTSPDTESAPIFASNGSVLQRHHNHQRQPIPPTTVNVIHRQSIHLNPQSTFALNNGTNNTRNSNGHAIYAQPTNVIPRHHQQQFLSASVSNLTRTDSALLNKRPRPLSQIMEHYNYGQVVNQKSRWIQQLVGQQLNDNVSQQNTLSSISSFKPSSSASTLTNSCATKGIQQNHHYYYHLPSSTSSANNSLYPPNNRNPQSSRLSHSRSFHDDSIMEAADENTDCSSDLTDGSPEKVSPSRRSRRSSDGDVPNLAEEDDAVLLVDRLDWGHLSDEDDDEEPHEDEPDYDQETSWVFLETKALKDDVDQTLLTFL